MTKPRKPSSITPLARVQTGQAMVFTLLFAAASALIALLMFNSGMLVNAKTRLQNAADAGAYSAAVLQARDHNFSAYTNRAIVANQVAVVQIASIKSYLEDARHTHERMGETTLDFESSYFPDSKPLWDFGDSYPIENIANTFEAAAPTAVQALDRLIGALETAQDAHHTASRINMVLVAVDVVKKNDPLANVTTGMFAGYTAFKVDNWMDSSTKHSANDNSAEADRFANVVVSDKSTDHFTRERGSIPVPAWATQVSWCKSMPFYAFSFTHFNFTHDGGSMLSADKKRWLALDATWGVGSWTCVFDPPCPPPIMKCIITLGSPLIDGNIGRGDSGGAVVGADGGYDSKSGYAGNPSSSDQFGGALTNPLTFIPANMRYKDGPGSTLDSAGGLQDYYRDVSNPTTDKPINQTAEENGGKFAVTIEVERTEGSVRTSSKILSNSDQLKLKDGMQAGTMRALSSAHAYFYRAKSNSGFNRTGWQRADDKTEVASLFNPYWQSRLVDRTVGERTISWGAQK